MSGCSLAYSSIFSPSPLEARSHTFCSGCLLMAGQVGVSATSKDWSGVRTARNGQILQSNGFSSGGSVQPCDGSRNGQRASSFGSSVLYWSEMSNVYELPEVPAGRNFAAGKRSFNAGSAAASNTGVSHRLVRRKLQQNLQVAQSLLARIELNTRALRSKICPESSLAYKKVLLCVNLPHPCPLRG